ncbi:MAG: hypothetical protein Q9220_002061 [cf. Caloplaca sp. 1 TL-2023]
MAAPRRKRLAASRRRVDEEGEDEGDSIAAGVEDDSMSEASAISDGDEDADAEGSDVSDADVPPTSDLPAKAVLNGQPKGLPDKPPPIPAPVEIPSFVATTDDTAAMRNGLQVNQAEEDVEEIEFDDLVKEPQQHTSPINEDKSTRTTGSEEMPIRLLFLIVAASSCMIIDQWPGAKMAFDLSVEAEEGDEADLLDLHRLQHPPTSGPTDAPWAHDLHETVVQPANGPATVKVVAQSSQHSQGVPLAGSSVSTTIPPNRSFSRTTKIGKVQIRIFLSGMAQPIIHPAVPVNQHTRLPQHRPPLRRDKPVRVSLPDMAIRYIFPSMDRSFIFIPRALRPNQQGFGRSRARGSFGQGYGALSSRRTSAYAGSNYSPSVALSRRSSLAAEVVISPPGIPLARPTNIGIEAGKPVVRLPPAAQQVPGAIEQDGGVPEDVVVVNLPQGAPYPLPEKPAYRENRPVPIPMHQPKPQKAVSVNDIESPATFAFNPPQQQDQQPFHQQVPIQVKQDPSLYPHSRHPSHPSQASGGTPLSQIPERAAHAHPFQPYAYQQPPPFYPQQYPATLYYYPSSEHLQAAAPSVIAPPFVPGQPYPYAVPVAPPPPTEPTSQPGTVAHESNGMVYYYDSSQLHAGSGNDPPYTGTEFAVPQSGGVVGMGGMMTPPMQYYPQPSPAVYYPPA